MFPMKMYPSMILEVNHKLKKALLNGGAFFCALSLIFFSCADHKDEKKVFSGYAQGTTYNISYFGELSVVDLQTGIDSILLRMDYALSNYRGGSQISALNDSRDTLFTLRDSCGFWKRVWKVSQEVYEKSEGAFDPSIYPLVKAYGFGPNQKPSLDSTLNIDSIQALVNFARWERKEHGEDEFIITKPRNGQLDFNAVAQGLAVDYIAEFLEAKNIKSYFVELGGEVRVGNYKPGKEPWVLGIERPENTEERIISDTLQIIQTSVATSGSNRKFYELNGRRYSHALDPKSGEPVSHEILSVTVKHTSCAYADAWATAALVNGERIRPILEKEGLWYQMQ